MGHRMVVHIIPQAGFKQVTKFGIAESLYSTEDFIAQN